MIGDMSTTPLFVFALCQLMNKPNQGLGLRPPHTAQTLLSMGSIRLSYHCGYASPPPQHALRHIEADALPHARCKQH